MTEKRKTRVSLALLCGAVVLAAALILSGAVILAAAWVPMRVPHTSTPAPTPRLDGTLPAGPGAATVADHLAIRESSVVAAEVMGPGRFEYSDHFSEDVRARIEVLRARAGERSLVQANEALAPFGYRLESRFDGAGQKTVYDVYRQDESEPLLADLASIWRISINASGTEFLLVAESTPGARPPYVLLRKDQVEAWDPGPSALLPPAYLGDTLARITTTGFPTITYRIELDDQATQNSTNVVYTGTAVAVGAYMPLRSFITWDGHWALETDDHLVIDGQDIGQALGYDAAFGFARIGERSFYFFEQDGRVRISYGDQVLPNAYESVFHNQCCEASIHNVEVGPDAVWFHALRDGTWYFVEASLEE